MCAGKRNQAYLEVRLRRADLQHAGNVVRIPRPLEEDKEVLPRRAGVERDALAVGEHLVRRGQDGPVVPKWAGECRANTKRSPVAPPALPAGIAQKGPRWGWGAYRT